MKSVRSELVSMAVVLSVPAVVAVIFPYGALGFRAASSTRSEPKTCAFVTLTPEAEHQAFKVARTSFRRSERDVRRMHADLSADFPPETALRLDVSVPAAAGPAELPIVKCERVPYLPSAKARPPVRLPPADKDPELPFPREKLLEIK